MDYNTQRNKLIISEYGRNIQRMIEYATEIEDREERNRAARAIIDVMGNLNPHLRDIHDFTHKLWDHLFIISDFNLDVDSPYPIPTRQSFEEKPKLLKYPNRKIKYMHYGKIIEDMIEKAINWEDEAEKEVMTEMIANQMKKAYVSWNQDNVNDDTILAHLREMSDGKLEVKPDMKLVHVQEPSSNQQRTYKKKRKGPKRHNQKRNYKN